jgi:hypothetical protein
MERSEHISEAGADFESLRRQSLANLPADFRPSGL